MKIKVIINLMFAIASNVPSIKERSAAMELLQVLNKDILRKSQDLVESLRKKEHTIAKQVMHTDSNDVSSDLFISD